MRVLAYSITLIAVFWSSDASISLETCSLSCTDDRVEGALRTGSRVPGAPGKRGPVGEKGNPGVVGDRGPRGYSGASCDCSRYNELATQVATLQDQLHSMRGSVTSAEEEYRQLPKSVRCFMGMKSGDILDSALTASSSWDNNHLPTRARLDITLEHGGPIGAWCSHPSDVSNPWIEVDLGAVKSVAGIITQARHHSTAKQWVTRYKVSCGSSSGTRSYVHINGEPKVFIANSDRHTKVVNKFPTKLNCRYVRILPQTWSGGEPCFRFELIRGECFNEY